jgi:hypothetical protein
MKRRKRRGGGGGSTSGYGWTSVSKRRKTNLNVSFLVERKRDSRLAAVRRDDA